MHAPTVGIVVGLWMVGSWLSKEQGLSRTGLYEIFVCGVRWGGGCAWVGKLVQPLCLFFHGCRSTAAAAGTASICAALSCVLLGVVPPPGPTMPAQPTSSSTFPLGTPRGDSSRVARAPPPPRACSGTCAFPPPPFPTTTLLAWLARLSIVHSCAGPCNVMGPLNTHQTWSGHGDPPGPPPPLR